MRTKIAAALMAFFLSVAFIGLSLGGSAPQLINYQGRITDASGQPPADGDTVDLTFTFYASLAGDTALLTVLQEDVVVTGGLYSALIGSGTITAGTEGNLAAVFQNHQDVWMGVKVGSDNEMTPRARITSAPYALSVDLSGLDLDGDGHYKPGGSNTPDDDCNDLAADVYPGATDACDGKDNDCDGVIDEDCPFHPDMVMVPAGCFEMGDHFNEGYGDQRPVHTVCVTSPFFMDAHEVTNSEYASCVGAGACTAPSDSSSNTRTVYYGDTAYDEYPVMHVSWNQASEYCAWADKRLPSEAEWEYAARGGLEGKRFPWGDAITGSDANFQDSGDPWDNDTSPVKYYAPNGYGLYDMMGNVYEWVNDWHSSSYYGSSPVNDPPGPASGSWRVLRGLSCMNHYLEYLVSYRSYAPPELDFNGVGFRCVRD